MALLGALLCVLANAFFVAAEFALAKVRPTALDALARTGDARARRALAQTHNLDSYLSATQFGITLASLALGWLGEPALARVLRWPLERIGASEHVVHGVALAFAFVVITLLHIVIGELVPKTVAVRWPVATARATAAALEGFRRLTYPALWVLNGTSLAIVRALHDSEARSANQEVSQTELELLIRSSFDSGEEGARKRHLMGRVVRSLDRPVRLVMVPRVDMVVLPARAKLSECMGTIRHHAFSRYPIGENADPDKIVGYIHLKDLFLPELALERPLLDVKRPILFVPETQTASEVLEELQHARAHLAVVVDEYGGTSGLVTVEDLIEELVGEIQDEHDEELPKWRRDADGSWVVDAAVALDELRQEGLELADDDHGETLGALLLERLGRLPTLGDKVSVNGFELSVEQIRRRRVERVRVRPKPHTDEGA